MFFGQSTVSLYHYIPVVYKCTPQPPPPPLAQYLLCICPETIMRDYCTSNCPCMTMDYDLFLRVNSPTPQASPKQSQSVRQPMNEPIATNREAAFTPHLPSRLPFDWSLWAAPTIPPSYPPRAVCSPLQNAMVCHFAPHPPLTMSIHVGILSCVWALSCWSLLLCVVFEGALQGSNGCKQLGRWGVEIFATLLSLVRTVPGL